MKRLKYFIWAATVIGVFASLHGGIYDTFRDYFFPRMKLTNPVYVAFLSSAIISTVAFTIIIVLGFFWLRRDRRQKREEILKTQEEISAVKQWFNSETAKLLEGMRRIVREMNIEIRNYHDCKKKKKEYNWKGWDRLVDICELVKGTSGLYNIGSDPKIEAYIDRHKELLVFKELRRSIIDGLNRVYRFLSNSGSEDIIELHRAGVSIEDVRDTHANQIAKLCGGSSVNAKD